MSPVPVLLAFDEAAHRVVIEGPLMCGAAIVLLLIVFILLLPWVRSDPI